MLLYKLYSLLGQTLHYQRSIVVFIDFKGLSSPPWNAKAINVIYMHNAMLNWTAKFKFGTQLLKI